MPKKTQTSIGSLVAVKLCGRNGAPRQYPVVGIVMGQQFLPQLEDLRFRELVQAADDNRRNGLAGLHHFCKRRGIYIYI